MTNFRKSGAACCVAFLMISLTISPRTVFGLAAQTPDASVTHTQHPRLLFGASEVPMLRARVQREPFASMLQAIANEVAAEQGRRSTPDYNFAYNMLPRNAAWMYLFTGEKKYAQIAEKNALELVHDTEFWNNPKSKGLTRAIAAVTVAFAYDTCHQAWSDATRILVSQKLILAANGLMTSMGEDSNTNIANNWQAVRYGAAGIAALACDEPGRMELARKAYGSLKRHLEANLGSNGWNPEGIGYTAYPWQFTGPFGVAAERAGIGDLRAELRNKVALTLWTTLVGTVNIPRIDGLGLRHDLSDDNAHYVGEGTSGLTFWYVPREYLPAARWMYDYLSTAQDGKRFFDLDRGGGIYSILFYPDDIPAKNPAEITGLNYSDPSHGVAIFRNAYRDENDIVALVNGHARQPAGAHGGPDTNTFRLIGLGSVWAVGGGRTANPGGQTNLFPGPPAERAPGGLGKLEKAEFNTDGGGRAVTTGSSMGVQNQRRDFVADYSQASGAPALFLDAESGDNARLWRLNTPEFNSITTQNNQFTISAPNGATLVGTVLEPAQPKFRVGQIARDLGGDGRGSGFKFRGHTYRNNKWIEFDCEGRVLIVMTLQKGAAPPVAVQTYRHGAQGHVGEQAIAYDRDSDQLWVGKAASALDIGSRKTPLGVRHVQARVLSDSQIKLAWLPAALGAEQLIVERREADAPWQEVASVSPQESSFVDEKAAAEVEYSYRVVSSNRAGLGVPSEEVKARAWQEGVREWIEDFAPPTEGVLASNSFGQWQSHAQNGRRFELSTARGSSRDAANPKGFMAIDGVPIGSHKAIFNENLRCDLSGSSSHISFDYRAQAATSFAVLLQLANGDWIASKAVIAPAQREQWKSLEFPLAGQSWTKVDSIALTRGEKTEVRDEQLRQVRGVGIWVQWVINDKWAQIDQFHLRAKNLHRTAP